MIYYRVQILRIAGIKNQVFCMNYYITLAIISRWLPDVKQFQTKAIARPKPLYSPLHCMDQREQPCQDTRT